MVCCGVERGGILRCWNGWSIGGEGELEAVGLLGLLRMKAKNWSVHGLAESVASGNCG